MVGRASASADPGVARDVSAHGSLLRRTEEQGCAMDDDRDDRSCSCQEGVLFIYPSTPNPNSHMFAWHLLSDGLRSVAPDAPPQPPAAGRQISVKEGV